MSFDAYKSVARYGTCVKITDTVYVVPQYTVRGQSVRVSKRDICVVERRRVDARDGPVVVYLCTCQDMAATQDTLRAAHHYTKDSIRIEPCYHTRVVMATSTWASPLNVCDDIVHVSPSLYMVMAEHAVVIRRTPRGGFVCHACGRSPGKHECRHVARLKTVAIDHPDLGIETDRDDLKAPKGRGLPEDAIRVPQQRIDIAPPPSQEKRTPNRSRRVARIYDIGAWHEYTYAKDETVDTLRATSCDRIFRYSREVWFTHRLIHLYLDNVARGNACFDAFHHTMELQYARTGHRFCSAPTTRTVLQAAFHHLDMDVAETLRCRECEKLSIRERVFILDGTSNGFLNRTKSSRETPCSNKRARPGSDFALVTSNRQRSRVLKRLENLVTFDRDSYIRDLGGVDVPGIVEFAKHALEWCRLEDVKLFMEDIGSPYPIISTVQREMVLPNGGLLERCMTPIQQADRDQIRRVWPALWRLLVNFTAIPPAWHRLCHSIRDLAKDLYETGNTEYLRWPPATEEHPFVCFPEFPRRRVSPWPRQASTFEASCTKHILQNRHFSPGLFLICCPHGKILGLCAMQEYESVHTAFEFLVERFDVAPGMVIYDNGCNLFRYGMMRCPGFFSQIRIMIDKFHSPGHVMCPPSFRFQYFPDDVTVMDGRLSYSKLNTQVVEQTNGRLRKFQQSLGYMTQENYVSFVKVVASLLNMYSSS